MDCPNHIRRTKSSVKKRIIVRRSVRSMFGEQTFAQLRTGLTFITARNTRFHSDGRWIPVHRVFYSFLKLRRSVVVAGSVCVVCGEGGGQVACQALLQLCRLMKSVLFQGGRSLVWTTQPRGPSVSAVCQERRRIERHFCFCPSPPPSASPLSSLQPHPVSSSCCCHPHL